MVRKARAKRSVEPELVEIVGTVGWCHRYRGLLSVEIRDSRRPVMVRMFETDDSDELQRRKDNFRPAAKVVLLGAWRPDLDRFAPWYTEVVVGAKGDRFMVAEQPI